MADSPETAVALSDDDLDDIVRDAEGGATEPVTDDPEPDDAPPAEADKDDAPSRPTSPPAGDEDEIDEPGTQAPSGAPSPAIPSTAQPFRFKGSGGDHEVRGAFELPDGSIVVPKESQADLRNRLAQHVELASGFKAFQRDMSRKLAEAKAERTSKDVESDAVLAMLVDIRKMSPDERWEFLSERFDQEVPKLELAIKERQLELRREALERQYNPQPTAEDAKEQRTNSLNHELSVTYHRLMAVPAIKALSVDEVNAVFQKHAKRVDRLVTKDDKGGEIFDDQEVVDDINLLLEAVKRRSQNTARQRNELRNADQRAIPPTVRPAAPASSTPNNSKRPMSFSKNRGSFKDAFMKGSLDYE